MAVMSCSERTEQEIPQVLPARWTIIIIAIMTSKNPIPALLRLVGMGFLQVFFAALFLQCYFHSLIFAMLFLQHYFRSLIFAMLFLQPYFCSTILEMIFAGYFQESGIPRACRNLSTLDQ